VWLNGICHDTSFSSIMSTTRNKFLDELTLGYSLGAAPTPRAVSKVRLRFGELKDSEILAGVEERPRAAFGVEGDTLLLKKGQLIY
jgi:hypothetical protein